jgi:nucleoid-associated protein YgaU
MFMKIITLFALILTLGSCSVSNKVDVPEKQDDLEFAVDTLNEAPASTEFKVEEEKVAEVSVPDKYETPVVVKEEAMTAPQEPIFNDFKTTEVTKINKVDVPAEITISTNTEVQHSDGLMETYEMQKGDTLMMASFKIYGDYRKWRDLKSWNSDIKKFHEGVNLKYQVADTKFKWMPSGFPYLVKTGDTLQVISMDKFGTTRRWKSIYNNNRPLIRNPNLIFAGFTIYYQPIRNLASEKK